MAAFHQGLKEGGYVEGQNVAIGQYDRLPDLAAELVRRQDRRVLLSGDSGGLDSVSPSFDVAPQQFCQVLGAPVLWRRHARSEVLHSLAHGRCVKCLGRCSVEAADNRLGRSLWEEKSVPTVDGHFCQAL